MKNKSILSFLKSSLEITLILILGLLFISTTPVASAQTMPGSTITKSSVSDSISTNWAGYVSKDGTYTSISGTWIIPTVTDTTALSGHATWVGIGGFTTNDLIQAGTQAVTDENGVISYKTWYELLPEASQPVPLSVKSGDSISATLTQVSGSTWNISIVNNTTGQNFFKTVTYASSLSSAEWVQEMASAIVKGGNIHLSGYLKLDNFGTINFINGTTVKNGIQSTIASSGAKPITMVNDANYAVAAVSTISSNGQQFSVTRTTAAPDSVIDLNSPTGYSSSATSQPIASNQGIPTRTSRRQWRTLRTSIPQSADTSIYTRTYTIGNYTIRVSYY